MTKPIAPDTLIEHLRTGEWQMTVIQGPNPTMFTTDETETVREAAAALEANNRQLQELRMQAIADTGQLQEALEKNAEKDRQLILCREALTPSGDTKAAYHGEFKFNVPLDGYDEDGEPREGVGPVYVPWDTVKEIMAAIRDRVSIEGVGE